MPAVLILLGVPPENSFVAPSIWHRICCQAILSQAAAPHAIFAGDNDARA